jgi:uncharacterized protein (TIGR02996 family)
MPDETETEAAFWQAIGANPADQLPRLVFADWLEERQGEVKCDWCGGRGSANPKRHVNFFPAPGQRPYTPPGDGKCTKCNGTGFVSDGRADLAAALRSTADRVPRGRGPDWWWCAFVEPISLNSDCNLAADVFDHLAVTGWCSGAVRWRHFPTAEAAVRDLCRAWIVHKQEVTT